MAPARKAVHRLHRMRSLPSPLAFGSSVWTLPGQTSLTVLNHSILPKQKASRYPVNLPAGNRLWEEPGLA